MGKFVNTQQGCRMTFRFGFGGSAKLDANARAAAVAQISTQSVLSWSETDVGVWLEERGLKNLVKPFVKNGINGEALATISESDLIAMKIDKLGERKALLKTVAELTAVKKSAGQAQEENTTEKSSTSQSST